MLQERGPLFKFLTMGSQNSIQQLSGLSCFPHRKGQNNLTGVLLEVRPMTIDKKLQVSEPKMNFGRRMAFG